MKVLVVIAALVAVAHCQALTSSEEALRQHIRLQMLRKYINQQNDMERLEQAVEQICPGHTEKFGKALQDVSTCMDEIDENEETACSAIKNHLQRCMKPLTGMFEKCLPEKSKDLPSFIINYVLALSGKVCKMDGEHLFELSNQCARIPNYRTKRCLRRLQTKAQQIVDKEMPSKAETCDFLKSIKSCLQSHLSTACGHYKTREAFLDLFDAGLTVCDGGINNDIENVEWGELKTQY